MAQMIEQNKTPEKELNEMEISNYQMQSSKHWLSGCSKNSLGIATALKKKSKGKEKQAEMKATLS